MQDPLLYIPSRSLPITKWLKIGWTHIDNKGNALRIDDDWRWRLDHLHPIDPQTTFRVCGSFSQRFVFTLGFAASFASTSTEKNRGIHGNAVITLQGFKAWERSSSKRPPSESPTSWRYLICTHRCIVKKSRVWSNASQSGKHYTARKECSQVPVTDGDSNLGLWIMHRTVQDATGCAA